MIFATVNNNILIHAGKILRVYEEPEEPQLPEKTLLFRFGNPDFDPTRDNNDNDAYNENVNKYGADIALLIYYKWTNPDYYGSNKFKWTRDTSYEGNVWLFKYNSTSWQTVFNSVFTEEADTALTGTVEILRGNLTGVTSTRRLFANSNAAISYIKIDKMPDVTDAYAMCQINNYHSKLETIILPDLPNVTSISYMFNGCSAITVCIGNMPKVTSINDIFANSTIKNITIGNLPSITTANNMFKSLSKLETVSIGDISQVTSANYMFNSCSNLKSVSKLNLPNVTSTVEMFSYCRALESIQAFDLPAVKNTSKMFDYCIALKAAPEINMPLVTNTSQMFMDCKSMESTPAYVMPNVTDINGMYNGCTVLKTVPALDLSSVTIANSLFNNCTSLEEITLNNTGNIVNFAYMFSGCTSLKTVNAIDITKANSGNGCTRMFQGCIALTIIPTFISTGSIALSVYYMFEGCVNVASGMLDFYNRYSGRVTSNDVHAFNNCGTNTETGLAELAQIPDNWK